MKAIMCKVFVTLAFALLALACGDAVCALEPDASNPDASVEPCPHHDPEGMPRASVHEMCSTSCFTELVCGVATSSCKDRCFLPYDGRTYAHYGAVRACLHTPEPLTCEQWRACMALP